MTSITSDSRSNRVLTWLTGGLGDDVPIVSPYAVAADGMGRIWVSDGGIPGVHVFDLARHESTVLAQYGKESMQLPLGLAFDADIDRLYVADAQAGRVLAFSSSGKWLSDWRTEIPLARPVGLSVGVAGELFVVDSVRGVVEVFDPSGRHLRTLGRDMGGYGGMNRPTSVAVDSAGRAFVIDSLGFRVVVFSPAGVPVGTVGKLGDAPGSLARPRGIAVDSAGHVYVSDAAFDNVQIFDLAGNTLLFFGSVGAGPGFFSLPAGLFFDESDRLYVVDAQNRRIQVFEYLGRP